MTAEKLVKGFALLVLLFFVAIIVWAIKVTISILLYAVLLLFSMIWIGAAYG